jgi:hypothetical protein
MELVFGKNRKQAAAGMITYATVKCLPEEGRI